MGFQHNSENINRNGKPKGALNKKTSQWLAFEEYLLGPGLERMINELEALKGKDYVDRFLSAIGYVRPRMKSVENKGTQPVPAIRLIGPYGEDSSIGENEEDILA